MKSGIGAVCINTGAKFLYLRLLFLLTLLHSGAAAQNDRKVSFTLKLCFGGISKGVISKYDHLDDSLAFTDPAANDFLHLVSFKISLACNGNVINYFENKSGNRLTPEMKDAIRELHTGCTITFQGIKALLNDNTPSVKPREIDPLILKLTLE